MMPLVDQLGQLSGLGAEFLWGAALVFFRVGAMFALLPAFGEQSVPQRVRLVLALAFSAVVMPAVLETLPKSGGFASLGIEVLVGLLLGAGLRLLVIALQTAAAIIAQATSLSQMFGGSGPEPQPAVGHLLTVAALALAVSAGLHVRVAELLIQSYRVFPPGQLPAAEDLAQWGLGHISHAFALGFSLAAPFTIAAFLYNLALGVINRAMPSLMVSFIGAPALAGGGLVLLALIAPLVLGIWWQAMEGFLAAPLDIPP